MYDTGEAGTLCKFSANGGAACPRGWKETGWGRYNTNAEYNNLMEAAGEPYRLCPGASAELLPTSGTFGNTVSSLDYSMVEGGQACGSRCPEGTVVEITFDEAKTKSHCYTNTASKAKVGDWPGQMMEIGCK